MNDKDIVKYKILKTINNYLELNQRQLSKLVGISLGNCNHYLAELLDDGYIDTCRDIEYRRVKMLYFLTDLGKQKYLSYCYDMLNHYEKEFDKAKFHYNEILVDLEKLDDKFCLDDYTRKDILFEMFKTDKKGGKK